MHWEGKESLLEELETEGVGGSRHVESGMSGPGREQERVPKTKELGGIE